MTGRLKTERPPGYVGAFSSIAPLTLYWTFFTFFKNRFIYSVQIPDGTEAPSSRSRVGLERGPDQNLVPKQTSQDQKIDRHEEPASSTADGSRALQPFDSTDVR